MKHGSYTSYIIGFLLSITLTLFAYYLAVNHILGDVLLALTIAGLAVVQALVQLLFFLHLKGESKPRWKLLVLLSMVLIVIIVVFGSLWIMQNLNYNMMQVPSNQTKLPDQKGI